MRTNKKNGIPVQVIAGYLLCVLMFLAGISSLLSHQEKLFNDVEERISRGETIVLDAQTDTSALGKFLYGRRFISDPEEARFVASRIVRERPSGGYENLGALMSYAMRIPIDSVKALGIESIARRAAEAEKAGGVDENYASALDTASHSRVILPGNMRKALISVKLENSDDFDANLGGVAIRLSSWHETDSKSADARILAYAVTDENGEASFYAPTDSSYSVLPILRGVDFGGEKGTSATGYLSEEGLDGSKSLKFTARQRRIPLITSNIFRLLRDSRSLIVRTPDDFITACKHIGLAYVIGWLLAGLVLYWTRKPFRLMLLIPLMTLTGLSFLALLGIQDPLNDICHAHRDVKWLIFGLAAFVLLSLWNYPSSLNKRGKILGLRRPDAFGYGLLAAGGGLLFAVCISGSSPAGSDAMVNLSVGSLSFQPSELCKFLFVGFMAYFFDKTADKLHRAEGASALAIRTRLRYAFGVLAVIFVVLGIYILRLKDMGPAMVLLVTLIVMYAMSRRDLPQMVGGTLLYGIFALVARWAGGTVLEYGTALLLWLVLWCLILPRAGKNGHRTFHESAVLMVVVIVAYTIGSYFLAPINEHLGERLAGRVEMCWGGVWDNYTRGGSQIAHGIWALASGGAGGLGFGNASPGLIPAAHTDMILTALGEMCGLSAIILVCTCIAALVYFGVSIGRRTIGFPRWLCIGISIVTLVQFLLVSLGSIGLIPLSGVAVPLLSKGGVSLLATLAGWGLVMSTSGYLSVEAEVTKEENRETAANPLCLGAITFCGLTVLIAGAAYYAHFASPESALVRPAYVVDAKGRRIVEYNPRIQLLINKLQSGNIFDRNGLLLATNSPEDLKARQAALISQGGLSETDLEIASRMPDTRIYPFGPYTLFTLGDVNSTDMPFSEAEPYGYMAEMRHQDKLRGFDFAPRAVKLTSRKFRPGRFLPAKADTSLSLLFNYTQPDLIAMLRLGLRDNFLLDRHNEQRVDHSIHLTIDAPLQKALSDALGAGLPKAIGDNFRNAVPYMRASAVVLDAEKGDLLASSMWPLPELDSVAKYGLDAPAPHERIRKHPAITERDLGTTYFTQPGSTAKVMSALAGLMKARDPRAAFSRSYRVVPDERVHSTEPAGAVNMFRAISSSSNNYFIQSTVDQDLYSTLDSVYGAVGVRLEPFPKGTSRTESFSYTSATPYIYRQSEFMTRENFSERMNELRFRAIKQYGIYGKARKDRRKLLAGEPLGYAWGQGVVRATPLAMARVASIIANGGRLASTRFLLDDTVAIRDMVMPAAASLLDSAMRDEARKAPYSANSSYRIGGKTGTPERDTYRPRSWLLSTPGERLNSKMNDAWYICYATVVKNGHEKKLAIALRIERSHRNSAAAKALMFNTVIPTLKANGYSLKEINAKHVDN